jgi:hypothetical protein
MVNISSVLTNITTPTFIASMPIQEPKSALINVELTQYLTGKLAIITLLQ